MGLRDMFKPRTTKLEAVMLEGDELVAAVGEASYQDTLGRVCGSTRWEAVAFECIVALVPEPDNPYDSNAVQVYADGEHVGYLSRGDAIDYGPAVRECAAAGKVIACSARIAGRGPDDPEATTENLGIFLKLPEPEAALFEIRAA